MARVVGATPAQLREAGREDAADELEHSVPVNTAALPKHGVQRLRDSWVVSDHGDLERPFEVLPASQLRRMSHVELVEWFQSQRDVAPQVLALLNESFPATDATPPELRAFESAKAEVAQTQKMLGPMLDIPEVQSQYMFRMLAALIIGIALTEDIQARREKADPVTGASNPHSAPAPASPDNPAAVDTAADATSHDARTGPHSSDEAQSSAAAALQATLDASVAEAVEGEVKGDDDRREQGG